jgi:hypothetical protein
VPEFFELLQEVVGLGRFFPGPGNDDSQARNPEVEDAMPEAGVPISFSPAKGRLARHRSRCALPCETWARISPSGDACGG